MKATFSGELKQPMAAAFAAKAAVTVPAAKAIVSFSSWPIFNFPWGDSAPSGLVCLQLLLQSQLRFMAAAMASYWGAGCILNSSSEGP